MSHKSSKKNSNQEPDLQIEPIYTIRCEIPKTGELLEQKIKAKREFLIGLCTFFSISLKDDDSDTECAEEYHGLYLTVGDDVPVFIYELCYDVRIFTIKCANQEEAQTYLKSFKEDFSTKFDECLNNAEEPDSTSSTESETSSSHSKTSNHGSQEKAIQNVSSEDKEYSQNQEEEEELEEKYPYQCVLQAVNNHIHLIQFKDFNFIAGFIFACKLCDTKPEDLIKVIYHHNDNKIVPLNTIINNIN